MAETMHVRLKAYNPKKGHVLRRYTVRSIRFQAGRGWYKVDADVAAYLEGVHQVPDDEDTPLAFDVCTEAEARAIDAREARAARQVQPAEAAVDVTRRRPAPVADVSRARRADVLAPRRVRAEAAPRIRREESPLPPAQHEAPPRSIPGAGPGEPREAAASGPAEGADEAAATGGEGERWQPAADDDPWEDEADLACDVGGEGRAEESFDAGLPADPAVPPDEEDAELAEDDVADPAEPEEDGGGELTTEDLPGAHGRRRRRGKRR